MRPSLLLLAPLALAACKPGPVAAPADPPRPVQIAEIRLAPLEAPRILTGTVRARREADLAFRAGGRIAERLVEIGDLVSAGQPLARLDPADLALGFRAAEADLAAAEAAARRAANEAGRARALLAAGHVAPAFAEERETTARSAAERAESARASLALARNRLGYATLLAPTGGVITARLAETGQVVPEGAPVFRMASGAEREIAVAVPEAALAALEAPAAALFWARPAAPLPVALREVSPQAEGALRVFSARFALPEPPDWVALGMTATIRLSPQAERLAIVPAEAVHDRGQGPMVWRVSEGRAEALPVEVVRLAPPVAHLRAPLAEGDRVVSLGPQMLDPGMAVRVIDRRLPESLR
jgi:membrane fusion protein, multidrug efflux system